jgi:hypothetical protein
MVVGVVIEQLFATSVTVIEYVPADKPGIPINNVKVPVLVDPFGAVKV